MAAARKPAVLLVDGYNIIGAWPRLCELRDRHGLEAARETLVEALSNYGAYQDYITELVFDAHYQPTPANREVVTSHLAVCYTDPDQTADSYIELACVAYFREDSRRFKRRLIVATSDNAHRNTITGFGAEWMSAHRLAMDVEDAEVAVRKIRRRQQTAPRPTLAQGLNPEVSRKLRALLIPDQG
jgi:predicted RNA-binding protein with PIN domain